MKRHFCICAFALSTLILTTPIAWSYPIQYTIEGQVIQGPDIDDSAGFLADMGITIGSQVSYTIVIDLDARGNVNTSDGKVYEYIDPYGRDIFYAHYLNGSTITTNNYMSSYYEYNYGGNDPPHVWERWLNINNGNNYLVFTGMMNGPWPASNYSAFGAGSLRNIIYDEFGNSSAFNFDAHITRAEAVPVPEPSTMLFIGTGLAGLLLQRKRSFLLTSD